jgi:hypothetical protein
VCTTYLELWDLGGRGSIIPIPFVDDPPSFKLFRFELQVLYYETDGFTYAHSSWIDETHLSAGWHIDASSVRETISRNKEGGSRIAQARFGAGGANPFGFKPVGFNADVTLSQSYNSSTGEVTGRADATINPFKSFTGLKEQPGFSCTDWY